MILSAESRSAVYAYGMDLAEESTVIEAQHAA
jgi:hypothetical protein